VAAMGSRLSKPSRTSCIRDYSFLRNGLVLILGILQREEWYYTASIYSS
jgi:hypothetical protein